MLKKRNIGHLKGIIFVLPSCIMVVLFIVFPVIESTLLSFTNQSTQQMDFSNYHVFFSTKSYLSSVFYTVRIVLITVILNVMISLLLALYLRFDKSKISSIIAAILPVPKFIPGIVAVYAFMTIIKNMGALTRLSNSLFGFAFRPDILHTSTGIIMMNLWFNVPFSTLLIGAALQGLNDSLIESARDVGASRLKVLKDIILPSISGTLLLVITFCFIGNIGGFTTPFLMGENKVKMLGVELFNEFSVYYNNYMAATISTILFVLSSVVSIYYMKVSLKKDV
ncbi:sugar ABC transporter permease [Vallitalea pronyensis]|uniref:Sugar ABC transporter permease n=1 Tax=Vallitalea pronyensis TaxID=1348613 RepID=A0A8J8SJ67_9FIRM|nr:sugar ABC transporter permease [Vallitalea pronyensis]QUI25346.1 sugar ABC transporter permease [Vallitalea pronyensis]